MSHQEIEIVGNLGSDPEMRFTPDGIPNTTFSMAVNSKSKGGETETMWIRATAWRRLAEIAAEFLTKGREVMVKGRLKFDKETGGCRIWQSREGQPRASFEMDVTDLILLGGRGAAPDGDAPHQAETEEEVPF